jgi:uncharacterized protein DUF6082
MMMYWLAVWQLGEVDDEELRGMAAAMFGSEVTRSWWNRVGENWIGTQRQSDRRRFVEIISGELMMATSAAVADIPQRKQPTYPGKRLMWRPARRQVTLMAAAVTGAGLAFAGFRSLRPPATRTSGETGDRLSRLR